MSAITLVEFAYLVEKGRYTGDDWDAVISRLSASASTFTVEPLDLGVAQAARRIPRDDVPDLPDRVITATALHLGLPLVTRDSRIRKCAVVETIW